MLVSALKTVRDALFTLAYPQQCHVCGRAVESWDDGVACAGCWDDWLRTELFTEPLCFKCGLPLPKTPALTPATANNQNERIFSSLEKHTCGRCSLLPFSSARACGKYSGALEANVLFLKAHPHIFPRMRETIIKTFSRNQSALESDLIIPVPLHPRRRRERGFNQAMIVARAVSAHYGAAVDDRSVVRVKHTEMHRAGMDGIDRAKSVERAFEVVRPRLIKGASALLIDDVYTTGSTINALTMALVEAGATTVNVFTIARV